MPRRLGVTRGEPWHQSNFPILLRQADCSTAPTLLRVRGIFFFVPSLISPVNHVAWTFFKNTHTNTTDASVALEVRPTRPRTRGHAALRALPTCMNGIGKLRPWLVETQNFFAKEFYWFEVLNEIYLQNFLHRWVVNRETNLMMLINSWFVSRFTAHPCKKFCK